MSMNELGYLASGNLRRYLDEIGIKWAQARSNGSMIWAPNWTGHIFRAFGTGSVHVLYLKCLHLDPELRAACWAVFEIGCEDQVRDLIRHSETYEALMADWRGRDNAVALSA